MFIRFQVSCRNHSSMSMQRPLRCELVQGHSNIRGRAGHTASLIGNIIYILGGRNGNEFFNDLWTFDTETEQWKQLQRHAPFAPRAYHTSTVMHGKEIWVIGGSDASRMFGDVHVLKTDTLEWCAPQFKGGLAGKSRGTHAAVVHPSQPNAILIYGGYGGRDGLKWLDDIAVLYTDQLLWVVLQPEGLLPSPRGYHTLVTIGNNVLLFGGKNDNGIVKEGSLSVYNTTENKWIVPRVEGEVPRPRSNHVAGSLRDELIIIHGGRHGEHRLEDIYLLEVYSEGQTRQGLCLRWHLLQSKKGSTNKRKLAAVYKADGPGGRSAHSLTVKQNALYIFGGYGGEGITFSDMYVIRSFPRFPVPNIKENQSMAIHKMKASGSRVAAPTILVDEQNYANRDTFGGWYSTKHARRSSTNVLQDNAGSASCEHVKEPQNTTETVSISMKHNTGEGNKEITKEFSTLLKNTRMDVFQEMQTHDYKEEAVALQKMVESLNSKLQEKTRSEATLQARTTCLEEELERCIRKDKSSHQDTVEGLKKNEASLLAKVNLLQQQNQRYEEEVQVLHKQVEERNKKVQILEGELQKLKTCHQKGKELEIEVQEIRSKFKETTSALGEREAERNEAISRMRASEKKLEELECSLADMKQFHQEVSTERDEYRSCVQKLEVELHKQMETLQQTKIKYESERAVLQQEVNERKCTADRLFTELGVSNEAARSSQDAVRQLSQQIEQMASKLETVRAEKEELNRINGSLSAEFKQLLTARDGAESKMKLLKADLQAARSQIEQNAAETSKLRDAADQARQHINSLHVSLKRGQDDMKNQNAENERLRSMIHEAGNFEEAQVQLLQSHIEKLKCAQQSCSGLPS